MSVPAEDSDPNSAESAHGGKHSEDDARPTTEATGATPRLA